MHAACMPWQIATLVVAWLARALHLAYKLSPQPTMLSMQEVHLEVAGSASTAPLAASARSILLAHSWRRGPQHWQGMDVCYADAFAVGLRAAAACHPHAANPAAARHRRAKRLAMQPSAVCAQEPCSYRYGVRRLMHVRHASAHACLHLLASCNACADTERAHFLAEGAMAAMLRERKSRPAVQRNASCHCSATCGSDE